MTYIPTGSNVSWITAMDLDFTTQSSQTIGTDTTFTIGGLTWTKMNSANDASPMVVTNGTGLVITPNSTSNITTGATGFSLPALRIPITSIISNFTVETPIRIWAWISSSNEAANFDSAVFGINVPNSQHTTMVYSAYRGFAGSANGWGSQINMLDANVLFTSPSAQPLTGNRVGLMSMPSGVLGGLAPLITGTTVTGGNWPAINSMNMTTISASTSAASGSVSNATSGAHAISEFNIFLGALRAGSVTSFQCVFGRLRVDYLPFIG